ncbi:unnamed protein product [Symbiodinium natans]|uniref:Uncharacterized protein n=1 Tax=Symbiodinium natans TaxID=878477 RepID=A0A812LCX1_9DINO|nr:unnamed protein product [Symbiodinium natans]
MWALISSRLDGPSPVRIENVQFGLVQDTRVCTNMTDLKVAGISLLQGTLEECAQAVAGPARSRGLCGQSGYFQFRNHVGGGCQCARDDCSSMSAEVEWAVYLVLQDAVPVGFRKMQVGKHCTNYQNLRVAGLWERGTLKACTMLVANRGRAFGCEGSYFQYRADNGDCGCATDTCDLQTENTLWTIYHVDSGVITPPLVPLPLPAYARVADGKHCSNYVNLRVAGLWHKTGGLDGCRRLAMGEGTTAGHCSGPYFQFAAGNQDCGCATDGCVERTTQANWAIYSSTAPHVWDLERHCSNYVNLRSAGLWTAPGSLTNCWSLAAARRGQECVGTYFQYASSTGDCGCATDACESRLYSPDWNIYLLSEDAPPQASTSLAVKGWRPVLLLALGLHHLNP